MRWIGLLLTVVIAGGAQAQETRRPSHCIAIADSAPGITYLRQASWQEPVAEQSVRIRYIAHSSFLLQTRGGIDVVTDFAGFIGPTTQLPDVVTMNRAHPSHYTGNPDPAIPYVLPGWGPFGKGIEHYLDLGEMLIRNVQTDIRSGFGGVEERGNSIFVFEVEGLCIGHLGHLQHVPTDAQFAALGRLDVVMAAVDGGMTMPLPDMIRVLQRLKSSVVIPMHWFSGYSLDVFLTGIGSDFAIRRDGVSSIEISLRGLPDRPTVIVLEPAYLDDDE